MSIKDLLKQYLGYKGWFLRRVAGLPEGVDLALSLRRFPIPHGGTVFDVGAHRGETIKYMIDHFHVSIFAFEPIIENFKVLNDRYANNTNVCLFNSALGSAEGSLSILLQSDSQTHSLLEPANSDETPNTELVDITTVDKVVLDRKIEQIDLLKIDTEGYELQVLEGAKNAMTARSVSKILCEVTFDPDDNGHSQFVMILDFVSKFGFKFCGLFDQVMWEKPARLGYANALFVHD